VTADGRLPGGEPSCGEAVFHGYGGGGAHDLLHLVRRLNLMKATESLYVRPPLLFRALSASQNSWTLTQGVALGYYWQVDVRFLHATETPDVRALICLNSLLKQQ
jgi:hypothetical protein